MKTVIIPGTDLSTSRFIFGTASLFRAGSRRTRRHLLDAAVQHGFLHFDTAPYYGFGYAERDLAPLLKAHPDVRVTTKVGLYSAGGESQSQASVLLRKIGGKALPRLSRPVRSFDLKRARAALEGSLRRLGREHIDLYMLHEPELHLLEPAEWLDWLESLRRSGQVGRFGLALTARQLQPFLQSKSPLADVVQVVDSLEQREADILTSHQRPLQITFGYVSAALRAGDTTAVPELLRLALQRNAHGAIIVSTRRPERLDQYARISEAATD